VSGLSTSERLKVRKQRVERLRRAILSRTLQSPLLRWRYGAKGVCQVLIVPPDLRTADPSFWREVELGQFGLAATVAHLDRRSPFEIVPPTPAWQAALHSFDWLRHLEAAGSASADARARELALEWTQRFRPHSGLAWAPEVTARRIISWLSHSTILLEGADRAVYDRIAESLETQIVHLSATWREAPAGYPRSLSLVAIVLADLCVAGREGQVEHGSRLLIAELQRQVMADGGHATRNPAVIVDLALDLLPLRQCFATRGRQVPRALTETLQRMLHYLRFMRLGDGMLARFNGVSVARPAALSTVLAYEEQGHAAPDIARRGGYLRIDQGATTVIADAAAAPPLDLSSEACAGCLSFEMSHGKSLILVNGGAPGPADSDWRGAARASASHNTLVLGEASSSGLVAGKEVAELFGGVPLAGPDHAEGTVAKSDRAGSIDMRHGGYLKRFGLMHERRLDLSEDGMTLEGTDRLMPRSGSLRLRQDVPFAIHFHLHPDAQCRAGATRSEVIVTVPDCVTAWRFSAEGAHVGVEESIYFADSAGPRHALQIILRGTTFGETEVRWRMAADAV